MAYLNRTFLRVTMKSFRTRLIIVVIVLAAFIVLTDVLGVPTLFNGFKGLNDNVFNTLTSVTALASDSERDFTINGMVDTGIAANIGMEPFHYAVVPLDDGYVLCCMPDSDSKWISVPNATFAGVIRNYTDVENSYFAGKLLAEKDTFLKPADNSGDLTAAQLRSLFYARGVYDAAYAKPGSDKPLTYAVNVLYVLVIAGVLGWPWWKTNSQRRRRCLAQLVKMGDREAMAAKLEAEMTGPDCFPIGRQLFLSPTFVFAPRGALLEPMDKLMWLYCETRTSASNTPRRMGDKNFMYMLFSHRFGWVTVSDKAKSCTMDVKNAGVRFPRLFIGYDSARENIYIQSLKNKGTNEEFVTYWRGKKGIEG